MTRPMPYTPAPPNPGPMPTPSPGMSYEDLLETLDKWEDARNNYREIIEATREKRLTDSECAAEYWREIAEFMAAMFQSGRESPDADARRAGTWYDFATFPHAFEGDNE